MSQRYTVMGAGEVGFHLASNLSREGHSVVVIETDPAKRDRVQDELDAKVVLGNGAHLPVLEAAEVAQSDLFMAVSSSDEANLAASGLAKHLGARRTVVRVGVADDVTVHRRAYEHVFGVDLLLSTQLLAATRILNHILGHNTLEVEYLFQGKIQLRKIPLERDSPLAKKTLREVKMPKGSLVVAFFRGKELIIPSGDDRARSGDDILVLCKSDIIDSVERFVGPRPAAPGSVFIAGGGRTCVTVAQALANEACRVKVIERDRRRAEWLSSQLPQVDVIHGDATDLSLLRAEQVERAQAFVSLMGNDERNLMANLLAREELGVRKVITRVDRSETSLLWRKLGMTQLVSPRQIASERIRKYIRHDYRATLLSLGKGRAQVIERRLEKASPAAGVTLAEMSPPPGGLGGAVSRGERVFVPRGADRMEVGDSVILFVQKEHLSTIRLLFPGRDEA